MNLKIKQKIPTAVIILVMTAGCSAVLQPDQVSDAPSKEEKFVSTQSTTTDAVAKAAQLTPQQVEQLKNIIFKDTLGKLHKVEAILPTYLPPGFKLESFQMLSDENFGEKYAIAYKNASNDTFKISAIALGPGAGPPPYAPILKSVNSPAFGEVIIGYTEFDKVADKSSTSVIIKAYPSSANNTSENSPSDGGSSAWTYILDSDTLSLAEAAKIVGSLSYLYPDQPRNIKFSNELTNDPEWKPPE